MKAKLASTMRARAKPGVVDDIISVRPGRPLPLAAGLRSGRAGYRQGRCRSLASPAKALRQVGNTLAAGLFCAIGILTALLENVSGQSRWVQTSLFSGRSHAGFPGVALADKKRPSSLQQPPDLNSDRRVIPVRRVIEV